MSHKFIIKRLFSISILVVAMLTTSNYCNAQFVKLDTMMYVDTYSNYTNYGALKVSSDNNLIFTKAVAGNSEPSVIFKVKQNGEKIWASDTIELRVIKIIERADSSLLLVGARKIPYPERQYLDISVVSMTINGDVLWQKDVGWVGAEYANDICLTSDGGFAVIGTSYSTEISCYQAREESMGILLKFDQVGNLQWHQCISPSYADLGVGVIEFQNSLFTLSNVLGYFNIRKYSLDGTLQWNTWTGGRDLSYAPIGFKLDSSGDLILFGSEFVYTVPFDGISFRGHRDVFVAKYSTVDGTEKWKKHFGGLSFDAAIELQILSDNSFLIAASTQSNDVDVFPSYLCTYCTSLWLLHVSNDGSLLNQKIFCNDCFMGGYSGWGPIGIPGYSRAGVPVLTSNNELFIFHRQREDSPLHNTADPPKEMTLPPEVPQSGIFLSKFSLKFCPKNQMLLSRIDEIYLENQTNFATQNHMTITRKINAEEPLTFTSGKSILLFPGAEFNENTLFKIRADACAN